ncbi:MAG: histidine kinase [Flavobacteriales bacterium]|jgi:tetratricopeptide (TPR) repeat protein|nr:histidine kinase [Flavobacteriales bacterium]
MKFFFFLILISSTFSIHANDIDSLKTILKIKENDATEKEKVLELLMLEYKRVNYDSSKIYCDKSIAILLSQNKRDDKRLAQRYIDKGSLLTKLYSFDSAGHYINAAIDLCVSNNNKALLGKAYNQLGVLYYKSSDYEKAIDYALKALKISEEAGISKLPPLSLISTSYYGVKNYKKALEYNELAEKEILSKKKLNLKDSLSLTTIHTNIAGALMHLQDSVEAVKRLFLSYKIGKETNNYKSLSYTSYALAKYYDSNKESEKYNIDSAYYYLKESLRYSKLTNDIGREVGAYIGLGSLLVEQNRNAEAYHELRKALNVAHKFGVKQDVEHLYYYLALAAIKECPDSVLFFLNKRDSIKSSFLNAQNIENINELTLKYDTEKKTYENQILKQSIVVQEKDFRLKIIIAVGIIVGTLFVALLMFLVVNRKKAKAEKELLELEQKLLRTQMNPHFIFNSLATIGSFIRANKKEESYRYITRFGKLMRAILECSREESISLEKEIEIIENFLFLHKLRLGEKLNYQINVDDEIDVEEYDVPPMLLQPFIENAIEHGVEKLTAPSQLIVNVKLKERVLILEVEDEGKGFKQVEEVASEKEGYKSYAIQITRERIENMRNKQSIELAINNIIEDDVVRGTRVALVIN